MTIPTKAQWQALKKTHGIPSNLIKKVKMGDAFDKWDKAETKFRNARDYAGCLKALDELVSEMKIYNKALKEAEPKKFAGKKPTDQQKNYKGANEKYKQIFGDVSKAKIAYEKLAKPVLGVQLALQKAQTKFKSLKIDSTQDEFSSFYSEEFRGINLPLKMLAKVNQDPDIKRGIVGFLSNANTVNNMIGLNKEPFDAKEAYGRISTSLSLLAGEIAGKK